MYHLVFLCRMPYLLNEEDSRTSCQQEAVNMLATPGSASQSLGCTGLLGTLENNDCRYCSANTINSLKLKKQAEDCSI